MRLLLPAALILLGVAPPRLAVADTFTTLSWHGATPDTNTCATCVKRTPAVITAWDDRDHDGFFDTGEAVFSFTPMQTLTVNGVEWPLQRVGNGWWFTHPDHLAVPFSRTGGMYCPAGCGCTAYSIVQPEGFRVQAQTVYISRGNGVDWSTGIIFDGHSYNPMLGGTTNTREYELPEYPGVFGSCDISAQSGGWPGNLLGYRGRSSWPAPTGICAPIGGGGLPAFYGWTWDHWISGVLVFGPDAYAIARNQPADFNHNGSVTVQDIFDYLTACTTGDPRAGNIFDFLSAWFANN